jgi:hypothetical protein
MIVHRFMVLLSSQLTLYRDGISEGLARDGRRATASTTALAID